MCVRQLPDAVEGTIGKDYRERNAWNFRKGLQGKKCLELSERITEKEMPGTIGKDYRERNAWNYRKGLQGKKCLELSERITGKEMPGTFRPGNSDFPLGRLQKFHNSGA